MEILEDVETTYDYWTSKAALRFLKEYDIPNDLYVRPEETVESFHKQFPLPERLYSKWKNGIMIWPKIDFMRKRPITNEPQCHRLVTNNYWKPTSSGNAKNIDSLVPCL